VEREVLSYWCDDGKVGRSVTVEALLVLNPKTRSSFSSLAKPLDDVRVLWWLDSSLNSLFKHVGYLKKGVGQGSGPDLTVVSRARFDSGKRSYRHGCW